MLDASKMGVDPAANTATFPVTRYGFLIWFRDVITYSQNSQSPLRTNSEIVISNGFQAKVVTPQLPIVFTF